MFHYSSRLLHTLPTALISPTRIQSPVPPTASEHSKSEMISAFSLASNSSKIPKLPLIDDSTIIKINNQHYLIESVLGQGTTSNVYLASTINKKVVIKDIHLNSPSSESLALAEVSAYTRLLEFGKYSPFMEYDISSELGFCRIVFEFEEGCDIFKIKRNSIADSINLFYQVCLAIKEIHEIGILHLDIKPSNLRILSNGSVRLLDFGCALIMPPNSSTVRRNYFYGTLEYCSPEQLLIHEMDQRSDIYSLGVLLYGLIANKVPFQSKDFKDLQIIPYILFTDPPQIPHADPKIWGIIQKCLRKNPSDRFETVESLIYALSSYEPT